MTDSNNPSLVILVCCPYFMTSESNDTVKPVLCDLPREQ